MGNKSGGIDGIYVALRGDYRQLESDLKEARRVVKDASTNMSDALGNALSPDKLKRNLGAMVADLSQLQRSAKMNAESFKNIGFSAKELGERLNLPEKQLAMLQNRMMQNQAAEAQINALRRIGQQAGLTAAEIKKLGQQMGVSDSGIAKAGGGGSLDSMIGGAGFAGKAGLAAAGVYAVGRAAQATGQAIFESGSKMERLNMSLVAITGSKAAASETLSYLRTESDKAGVSLLVTADAYKSLLAAGNASGMAEKDIRDLFSSVVEAGAVVGMSNEQQSRSLIALQQMISKGVVSSEELKQQLGENLPGAFAVAAKAVGKTTQEFTKMLASGEVIAKDFLPKFASALRNEFGASIEDASNTGTTAVNRVTTSWELLKESFYNSGVVVGTLDNVRAALERMRGAADGYDPLTAGSGRTIDEMREARAALEERLEGMRAMGDASPKVEALRKLLAELNREILNAQVALGKNVEDRSRPKTDKQQLQDAADAAKVLADQQEKQLEAAKKLQAVMWDIKIATEAGGSGNVEALAALQEQKQHAQAMLDLQRELAKAKTDSTIDGAAIKQSMGLENQRHAIVMENIRKEAKSRESSMLAKINSEREASILAQKQAQFDVENEEKLSAMAIARSVGGGDIEDKKAQYRALYEVAAMYTDDHAALQEQLNHKLAALDVERFQSSRKRLDGMHGALLAYSEDAGNAGKNSFDMWTNSIKGTEDALTDMIVKGKVDVSSFFQMLQAEIVRTQAVRPAMAWASSALGNINWGSMFGFNHGGGMVGNPSFSRSLSPAVFADAPRFHAGGWPGLASDEVPIIAQKGERVLSKAEVAAGAASTSSGSSVHVLIQNYTGAPVKTQESSGAGGQRQLHVIIGEVVKGAFDSGLMDRTMNKNYGVRRQGY